MLVLALNPAHDGAAAVIGDRRLLLSLESEKDSFPRHSPLTIKTFLEVVEHLSDIPDVVALGGWNRHDPCMKNWPRVALYSGHRQEVRSVNLFGKQVTVFSSSHERSHIMGAIGMAPRDDAALRAVLVWEGAIGSLYLVDENWSVASEIPVLPGPGTRYAFLYGLADPSFPDTALPARGDDSGKLMALAAYGDAAEPDPPVVETVERILEDPRPWPISKYEFRDSPIYNAGVEAEVTKVAAALLTERIFEIFAAAAREHLPRGIPLHIAGGCGLNCDWNVGWRELGHFSSVFVPPCADDSGSAIGTGLDALVALTGDPYVDWDVYSGLEFEWDRAPDPQKWKRRRLDLGALAEALLEGRVVAWVQGRAEIGPRALGNRSLLAEPFDPHTNVRLNEIKLREGFRPVAPCCRLEDAGKLFDADFEDPYMLYFRNAKVGHLGAVTHVDGTARCQTVTAETNKPLYGLLSVFADRSGVGILCNTSLNFKHFGFINKMSDLVKYCEERGIEDFVVGDAWFRRVRGALRDQSPTS
jgi:hydroxymethyl cephem carbamoyltransferase